MCLQSVYSCRHFVDTYEKAASEGGLIIVSNALLINHLSGADTRSRTRDLLITSQLLYQLSYVGASHFLENLIGLPLD